jgi:phosphoribosylglycinamide formyltransferase 1
MKKIALFASGSGSNVENIAHFFKNNKYVQPYLVLCNNPKAFVINRAAKLNIPVLVFNKQQFYDTDFIIQQLKFNEIDIIVLAGFLWLIPPSLIEAFPNRIINIHPALLPKYGGKGMYGMKVHQAIIDNKEKESGITIHLVNEEYDKGKILFQAKCNVTPDDKAESVATKVHDLEYKHFPEQIEKFTLTL